MFGNAGIGIVRGPKFYNLDSSITKRVVLTERFSAEARMDFFDTFNHPNPSGPNTTFGSPGFGEITSTVAPGGNREGQLSLKLFF
jgi:hypothetical protein